MQRLTIPAHDRAGVRVFTARLTQDDMRRDKAALAVSLLGDPHLDPAYLEIFDLADLSGVGLSHYLTEGLGVPDTALRDPAGLDALQGPVVVLLSKALHGRDVTLTLDPRLTLVGTYAEDHPPVHFEPLPTATATGILAPDLPPDPTPQRPTTAFLLLGAALLLGTVVALWLALG
jgi:hypothetical protein